MIKTDSISLINGLALSSGRTEGKSVKEGSEESFEQFDQVLVKSSERKRSLTRSKEITIEGEMKNRNIVAPIIVQSTFPGEEFLPLQDVEENKKVTEDVAIDEAMTEEVNLGRAGVIVASGVPMLSEMYNLSSIGIGSDSVPGTHSLKGPSSKIEGELLLENMEMLLHPESEKKGPGPLSDLLVSASEPSDILKVTRSVMGPNNDSPLELDSEGIRPKESLPANLDGEGRVPGMEALVSPDQLDLDTASHRSVIGGRVPGVDMRPEHLRQMQADQALLVDLDLKGHGDTRSPYSNGSGGANLEGGKGRQFQAQEGDKIPAVLPDPGFSEAFSIIPHADLESGFDLDVKGQVSVAESRLPDAFSPDKILFRQVAEKIQLWRPLEGGIIRFQLEPETLGMIQVDISTGDDGIIADIIAEHHFVKALLEQNQNLLHETLTAEGLSIDRFSVNVGTADHHNADRQDDRLELEVPRSFDKPESRALFSERTKMNQAGDHRINLYV